MSMQGGSLQDLRSANIQKIIDELQKVGSATQADLASATGLSKATVSSLVSELEQDGRIRRSSTTASGRRAWSIELVQHEKVALGIEIGEARISVALVSRENEIIGDAAVTIDDQLPLDVRINRAEELARAVMDANNVEYDVVGLAVPCPVTLEGRISQGFMPLPAWLRSPRFMTMFEEVFEAEPIIESAARLGALAERSYGPLKNMNDFAYVLVDRGVEVGLMLGGQLRRGFRGHAGELGHLRVATPGNPCRCGNHGCLETMTSFYALSLRWASVDPAAARVVDPGALFVDALMDDDILAQRIFDEASEPLARSLASYVNLVDVPTVVLGGPLARAEERHFLSLRLGFERALSPAIHNTKLIVSTQGEAAAARGAAWNALLHQ